MSKLRIVVLAPVNGRNHPIFTFERAIDKPIPFGNFASGKVSIGGKRYSLVLDTDKQIYPGFPKEGVYEACMALAYQSYVKACRAESVDPHTREMWAIHGYPLDSIGSRMDWSYEKVPA